MKGNILILETGKQQKKLILYYELSDYFSRFLSYIVDLFFIMSIVTLVEVYFFNEPPIIYQFPYYYLYTHNSIQRLLLNNNGLDFLLLFLLINFFYYLFTYFFGYTIGGFLLNMRVRYLEKTKDGKVKVNSKLSPSEKLKKAMVKSITMTIPFMPVIDNLLSKNGVKYTDRLIHSITVISVYMKPMNGLSNSGKNKMVAKVKSRLITYDEFIEYHKIDVKKDRSNIKNGIGKMNTNATISMGTAHSIRISDILKMKIFYLTGFPKINIDNEAPEQNGIYKVIRKQYFSIFYISLFTYFIPFITAILVGLHTTNVSTFPTPLPLATNKYSPANGYAGLQQSLFNNNIEIDLKFFILGGISMFFLSYLGIYSSVYIPNLIIASSLHSQYWYFLIYAVVPQAIPEALGYVFGISAGLYLSKILVDSFISYVRGIESGTFLRLIYENLEQFFIYFAISFFLILFASYIEAYVTSYLLNHLYFVRS